jgi:penicillin-insensitive murein DD-endopeptidase
LATAGGKWFVQCVRKSQLHPTFLALVVFASSVAMAKPHPKVARVAHVETSEKRAEAHAISVGSPTDGKLQNGARIETSSYLRISPQYAGGDVRYGLPLLVSMVDRSAHDVAKKFAGSVMNLGHLSRKGGGELDRHASHESGRDADIGFYVRSSAGKHLLAESFVAFRGDGKAPSWPGALFDDARNWALVSALVTDPKARVTHIFVATPLRERLLNYAQHIGAHADIQGRAREVLAQPKGALPHDDHFHVRIGCPSGMSACVENPTPPKHREQPVARGGSARGGSAHVASGKKNKGAPATHAAKPASQEDALGKLLEPRVEGLDSVVIPSRMGGVAVPVNEEPVDDVDGQLPESHE